MTQTSTARRVGTVSGGALLLCLSFGGTALAASSPASGSGSGSGAVSGVVSAVTSPLPLPLPSGSADPVQAVTQTVQKVAQTVGVPVPTTTPTATPAPAPSGGKTKGTSHKVPTTSVKAPRVAPKDKVLGIEHSRPAATSFSLGSLSLGGLRGTTSVPAVSDPVVAPQQTAVLAAGQTPALAPAVGGLTGSGPDGGAPRGLFIALATMVIGGLAAGHVKVIQDRLKGLSGS